MEEHSPEKGKRDFLRLIDSIFPLRQASLDSIHEKYMRAGHISTLHIWPARRPLAASRAVLISALLPNPKSIEEQKELIRKIGGIIIQESKKTKKKDGTIKETQYDITEGGILHWGRENSEDYQWLREAVSKVYGKSIPRILDPFSGGGSIPLEAMRLGCEAIAMDLNPVAYFILKCTLEYPQKLANESKQLPSISGFHFEDFVHKSSFITSKTNKVAKNTNQMLLFPKVDNPLRNLPDHIRYWGNWILQKATLELRKYYPVQDEKPVVAYLWARTVVCSKCGITIPIFKTRWLCNTERKKILLPMSMNVEKKAVIFGEPLDLNREKQKPTKIKKHITAGTLSKSGATCPNCKTIITKDALHFEGMNNRLGSQLMAVVIDGEHGKEYRTFTSKETEIIPKAENIYKEPYKDIPFGLPNEPTPKGGGSGAGRAFSIYNYGFKKWADIYSPRQLLSLGIFVKCTRAVKQIMIECGYSSVWIEAITCYLAAIIDRFANQCNTLSRWAPNRETIQGIYSRFALPMLWDYAEVNPVGNTSGSFANAIEWVSQVVDHLINAALHKPAPTIIQSSAMHTPSDIDLIITDPPYYDSIPYSDLMDFFYVWLKRTLNGISDDYDKAFKADNAPKWDREKNDGELIDDESRFDFDSEKSKSSYENGMARVFQACYKSLKPDGRLIIVFANKQPDAWETLVSAIIRAGFIVTSSWPIQTEMKTRTRALSSAALSSSVWLVCKKRLETTRPGWDNIVLEEMGKTISIRLRGFWDAGIRGPDFVWAAIGPALEEYSKYPVVKKANEPGVSLQVTEFLQIVRRIVVDFVVGRVLSGDSTSLSEIRLDDLTTYYLLHRYNYGLAQVPIGACILYAISCNLSDAALIDRFDILEKAGDKGDADEDDDEAAEEDPEAVPEKTKSTVKLVAWNNRKQKNLGSDIEGRPAPIIDKIHKIMQLWKQGDLAQVNAYVDQHGLRKNTLFHQILQALIELASQSDEERSLLESISNHIGAKLSITQRGETGLYKFTQDKQEKEGGKDE
nr:DUF1156 domain-containing protein [Candidatus Sigynarchaeota archaeon]